MTYIFGLWRDPWTGPVHHVGDLFPEGCECQWDEDHCPHRPPHSGDCEVCYDAKAPERAAAIARSIADGQLMEVGRLRVQNVREKRAIVRTFQLLIWWLTR